MKCDSIVKTVASEIRDSVSKLRSEEFINECTLFLENNGEEFKLNSGKQPTLSNSPGIYLFWAEFSKWIDKNTWSNAFDLFLDQWSNQIEEIQYYPRFNKKRATKTFREYEKCDWLPFYLGKARNINSRVHQHITLEKNKKTYALKLDSMSSNLTDINFLVSELPLSLDTDNYFLLELIESELRNRLNPIIGKQ